jgi:hypothetical protein
VKSLVERGGNSIALKKELTKQNLTLEKAKSGLWYLTIAIFSTAILYAVGATLALLVIKKGIKHSYQKIKNLRGLD